MRTSTTEAVVLRKIRIGEIHKALTLFSPERGLLSAIAHGAFKMKSRLRTASEPFHVIRVYLYHNPVRNQYKITDIESLNALDGIRRSVERYYAASLWAEVIIRSYGGGESFAVPYRLLVDSLSLLDHAQQRSITYLTCQYLMRFLDILGQRPDLEHCNICASGFDTQSGVYLSREERVFVCNRCAKPSALYLPAGARRYLESTLKMPLEVAVRVGLEDRSIQAVKEAAYFLVQAALETDLKVLKSGVGIL